MTVRRPVAMIAGVAGAAAAVAAATVWPALPAQAHGAPVRPISRTAACADGSADAGSAACRAARDANGRPFGSFDNLRRPGVNGRDRQVVPDGRLCSGGLAEFSGLDLPRTDWPASTLTAGRTFDLRYRTTIPHRGTFRIYLTRPDYRPGERLRWADLQSEPILTVADPPLRDGAYRMSGRLPADRSGRHLLYTVWQTSDTPDTYYSCSDVVLTAAGSAAAGSASAGSGSAAGSAAGAARRAAPQRSPAGTATKQPTDRKPSGATGSAASAVPKSAPDDGTGGWLSPPTKVAAVDGTLGPRIVSAALVVLVAVTAGMAATRIRAARRVGGVHRRPEER